MNGGSFKSFKELFGESEEDLISDLISLNREGFLVGPREEKPAFFARVARDREQSELVAIPESLRKTFDIEPVHLKVIYSNEGIGAWEGACTWIESSGVTIQLREQFFRKSRMLFYSKEEVLAHEAVHAVRMKFHEPIFEEILAYRTSRGIRKYLGPLFRHPGEVYWTFLGILVGFFVASYSLFFGLCSSLLVPLYFFVRLVIFQRIFARAAAKIRKLLGVPPLWVMLRLTDAEIRYFASQPLRVIEEYAKRRRAKELRWQQIYASYFI